MRESWTDDRLDTLNFKVDEGFRQIDGRFQQVDERFKGVDERFKQVDQRFEQVDRRFDQVDHRFDRVEGELGALRQEMNMRLGSMQEATTALHRTMVQFAGAAFAAFAALFSAQIALFLTLL